MCVQLSLPVLETSERGERATIAEILWSDGSILHDDTFDSLVKRLMTCGVQEADDALVKVECFGDRRGLIERAGQHGRVFNRHGGALRENSISTPSLRSTNPTTRWPR